MVTTVIRAGSTVRIQFRPSSIVDTYIEDGFLFVVYSDGEIDNVGPVGGGGTPTPTPSPVFTTDPSINPTGGTVGDTFAGVDGVMDNGGTVLSRRWLLDGDEVATTPTYAPSTSGSLVFENTGTGGVVATSAAVTVAASAPTPMSFAAAGDHVNTDYANSSIAIASSSSPSVNIRVEGVAVENEGGGWWSPYIALEGCAGKTPSFSMPNTDMWTGSFEPTGRVLWSYDNKTWQDFDNNSIAPTSYLFSNNLPFTQDKIYVSLLPSIPVGDRAGYFAEIAAANPARFRALPGATTGVALIVSATGRVGVSGQTIPELPMHGAQIEDFSSTLPKRTLVMMMATHPGEDHAEREALAFLRAFTADDWLMARWRVLVYWVNPAGQYGGSRRTTFEGTEPGGNIALADNNSNRGFTTEPSPLSDVQAIKSRILADIAALGKTRIQAFLDFHGAPFTDRSYTYGGPLSLTNKESTFVNIWTAIRSSVYVVVDAATAAASYSWAKLNFSPDFSLSTEVGSTWGATSEASYDVFGIELVTSFKTATGRALFSAPQTQGTFRARTIGGGGLFDLQSPAVVSVARNAWSI